MYMLLMSKPCREDRAGMPNPFGQIPTLVDGGNIEVRHRTKTRRTCTHESVSQPRTYACVYSSTYCEHDTCILHGPLIPKKLEEQKSSFNGVAPCTYHSFTQCVCTDELRCRSSNPVPSFSTLLISMAVPTRLRSVPPTPNG